jgi:hypothetical protein
MLKKKIVFIILLAVLLSPVVASAAVGCGEKSGGNPKLEAILQNVSNAASTVGAAIAVIGFIIAGILYLTAGGSPEKTGIAKKALFAAVIGTAILALAQGANIMTDIFCAIIKT